MRSLILSPDWDAILFWRDEQSRAGVDERNLPISEGLRIELNECGKWFSEMFLAEDSKATSIDKRLFDERAFHLWERLQKELGTNYRVLFWSQEFACEFNSMSDFQVAQRAAR